jgi:hypothetical protein
VREALDNKTYGSIDAFLKYNGLSYERYLNLIRAKPKRPSVLFKRTMQQIFTNTFNPWIANVLNSNTDLQFILDEQSCAEYVVEYVNKSNKGISNLHRELLKLHEEHLDCDYSKLLTKVNAKMLNAVETSAQEAACYLLRMPMSVCSRIVYFIPNVPPHERHKAHKR